MRFGMGLRVAALQGFIHADLHVVECGKDAADANDACPIS